MPNFFSEHSPFLAHPLLTPARSAAEVEQLIRIFGIDDGDDESAATLLDIGCGFGRHSIELAQRGHHPLGIDPSAAMIEAATSRLTPGAEAARFRVDRGEDLQEDSVFDGAFALFTTLGQVNEYDEDNREMLPVILRALRPGARFVLEVPNAPVAIASLVAEDAFGDKRNGTTINRRYDQPTGRIIEHFEVRSEGQSRQFDLAVRVFGQHEVASLLTQAGFQELTVSNDLAGAPGAATHEATGPTMVFTAKRP